MCGTKTTYFPEIIDSKTAEVAFDFLKNNTPWVDSIYSKKERKISRKGYSPSVNSGNIVDDFIVELIASSLLKIKDVQYDLLGIYVNYYASGTDFCPKHAHKGSIQFVLSLGATRKFSVGKKEYDMKSGDAILFGSSTHGIPIQPEVKDGRISVAVFIQKAEKV
jgi:hypothetical protein